MTAKEKSNIKIQLRRKGWSADEIKDFFVFVETNKPTAQEAEDAKKGNK